MKRLSHRRLFALYRKEMVETFRDWKILSLVLTFAPFFVLLMYGYLGHTTPTYQIAVVNQDEGVTIEGGGRFSAGDALIADLEAVVAEEGNPVLRLRPSDPEESEDLLRDRRADLVVLIPPDFSQALARFTAGMDVSPARVITRGDPANPDYLMAAVWTDMVILQYVGTASEVESPVDLQPETVTGTASLTDFDLYVPALLVLALMMLLFTAAGALIREKDKGTIIRLRLSNMRLLEWLTAVSTTQILVGLLALFLTYLTAYAVGYRSSGSLAAVMVVGGLTSLSVMAFSVLVAASLRTVFDLVTVGSFPFFILMFFSGGMFPLPGVPLFSWGERVIELNEILPTTHGIAALERVLSFGVGLGDLGFELQALVLLTALYFALGTWIFTRRHMPAIG
jgi:ABC-2 type transport system permease protein